tara:strand:- start:462 stop:587 length:126 start_codon:yes stop_codon:yes gene_type:complete
VINVEKQEIVLGMPVIDQIQELEINALKGLIQRLEGNAGDL